MKHKHISRNYFKKVVGIVFFITFFGCQLMAQISVADIHPDELKKTNQSDFQISLAQWSLYRSFFGEIHDWNWYSRMLAESPDSLLRGELDPINFPEIAASYGIYNIELVNIFYFTKVEDIEYLTTLKHKCDDVGVKIGLIMCDALGNLGDSDSVQRQKVVENYCKWVNAAKFLGAHSIRVSLFGYKRDELKAEDLIDGLIDLGKYGASQNINILVENDGGNSSDAAWLVNVIKNVGLDNVGTLPDFGNFCLERDPNYNCLKEYDKYKGIEELMPYAKAVSAKSYAFDDKGNERSIDYYKMMKIVMDSGYKGYIGIEYDGYLLSEDKGIKATKLLLEKVFSEL